MALQCCSSTGGGKASVLSADGQFQAIECDAVLEHVRNPERVLDELRRVLAPHGYLHLVTPFCHPFHAYPEDFRRFTLTGLKATAGDGFEVIAEGWRTGPTATLLIFLLEYIKQLLPFRIWRIAAHGIAGWILFPLRYLDLRYLRSPRAGSMGNTTRSVQRFQCLTLTRPSGRATIATF